MLISIDKVIEQVVRAFYCAPFNYGAQSTQEAIALLLAIASSNSYASFVLSNFPKCSIIPWSTLKHELIVDFTTKTNITSFCYVASCQIMLLPSMCTVTCQVARHEVYVQCLP